MKRKTQLTLLVLFNLSFLYGQVDESRNYLYLFSDSVIYGRIIQYKKQFVKPYFLINSTKVKPDLVKFCKNETGFYANLKNLNTWSSPDFAQRIRKGKINLYESRVIYTNGMPKKIYNYYNKGFGDLKKANYENLHIDLSDNPESEKYLDKYKSFRDGEVLSAIIGGVAVIAGFATLISKTQSGDDYGYGEQTEPDVTGSIVTIGLGTACFTVTYILNLSKPKHLKSAIDVYNY